MLKLPCAPRQKFSQESSLKPRYSLGAYRVLRQTVPGVALRINISSAVACRGVCYNMKN